VAKGAAHYPGSESSSFILRCLAGGKDCQAQSSSSGGSAQLYAQEQRGPETPELADLQSEGTEEIGHQFDTFGAGAAGVSSARSHRITVP